MKKFLTAAIVAATTTAASWAFKRWLDARDARKERAPYRSLTEWEGEGGALAPNPNGIETSQVPH